MVIKYFFQIFNNNANNSFKRTPNQYRTYNVVELSKGVNNMYYDHNRKYSIHLKDYGPCPFITNIKKAANENNFFRIALWTGKHLQLTLMSIDVGHDIGLEMHPNLDQFIRIEQGQGIVEMGHSMECLDFQARVYENYAVFIPAGIWHNLINTGSVPIKLYSIYAPPAHPHGTIHRTKEEAEMNHSYYWR